MPVVAPEHILISLILDSQILRSEDWYLGGFAQVNIQAYLTRRAGMFVDVVEQLTLSHLQRQDQMSALITAEW